MRRFESFRRETYLELWQTWCMRGTENPENVVRLHEVPQDGLSNPYSAIVRTLTVGYLYRIVISVFQMRRLSIVIAIVLAQTYAYSIMVTAGSNPVRRSKQ